MSVCVLLDIEGVLLPELWTVLADHTGEDAFRRTTTEEADIAVLMIERLARAKEMRLKRADIRAALQNARPLEGAVEFLRKTRARWPTILVSDSFYELLEMMSDKLLWPTVFGHHLQFDECGVLSNYTLRQRNQKPKVVAAMKSLGFGVLAAGDSLNDIGMLRSADAGALLNAREQIRRAHPDLPACDSYKSLFEFLESEAADLQTNNLEIPSKEIQ